MEVISGYHNLSSRHHGCVVTIGNFDGVHRGHQEILKSLHQQGELFNLPTTVVTFEPLPQEYFKNNTCGVGATRANKKSCFQSTRLTRLREKIFLLKKYNVDRVALLHFNSHLANLSAEEFVEKILVEALGVKYLLVGDDFQFGSGRRGDIALLNECAKKFNFSVEQAETISFEGSRISSSTIREALAEGNLQKANRLLGHSYHISGRVVHGEKIGRTLGVPTANILLKREPPPLLGIFAVKIHGLSHETHEGVANIGYRPTVSNGKKALLEIHLFDFQQEIYGRQIHVEFLHKIRDEKKFDSLEELREHMFLDIKKAKEFFAVGI